MPREMLSSGAALRHAKHKPNNQATPRNARSSPWIFLPPHGYSGRQSLQQVLSSQSWGISATAQGSSPQFMLHNAWLMRHHQSLELAVPLSEHQEQESSVALLVHRDNKAPWHSQRTVKSSAGSKTAQSQEDWEYQTLGSGSSCQHLLKHQPSSTSPTKPLVVVHPLTELVSSGLKPGNY